MPFVSFRWLLLDFIPCSDVSIADFEQGNTSLIMTEILYNCQKMSEAATEGVL